MMQPDRVYISPTVPGHGADAGLETRNAGYYQIGRKAPAFMREDISPQVCKTGLHRALDSSELLNSFSELCKCSKRIPTAFIRRHPRPNF